MRFPFAAFVVSMPLEMYVLSLLGYAFFKFGIPRAIELYTYYLEVESNALSCQIEGTP